MNPIHFEESNVVIAKNQPPYRALPAHRRPDDENGKLTVCWRLSFRERLRVLFRGVIWQQILTFREPLQPQSLLIDKPELSR